MPPGMGIIMSPPNSQRAAARAAAFLASHGACATGAHWRRISIEGLRAAAARTGASPPKAAAEATVHARSDFMEMKLALWMDARL